MHVTRKRQLRRGHRGQTNAKNIPQVYNRISMKSKKNYVERIAHLENKLNEAEENKIRKNLEVESKLKEIEEDKIRLNREVEASSDKYKNILTQLRDKIECPVCMEVPRTGPVPVCPNGHFVCQKCRTDTCPTCRVFMGMGKSLLAGTVIENVEHVCKFSDCGDMYALDKLGCHEKTCKHRTISCPHETCSGIISLSKLLDHVRSSICCSPNLPAEIRSFSPYRDPYGRVNFRIEAFELNSNKQLTWPLQPISYKDSRFAVCAGKFENHFYFTMVMFGSEEECTKFNVEMIVHEKVTLFQRSEVSFKYSGKPCSIDEEKKKVKDSGLTMNTTGMEKIVKKSDANTFSVTFSISSQ